MNVRKENALCSSELMKLPPDPDSQNEDIWELSLQVRSLREQLEEFEKVCEQKFTEQMCTLEGLLTWCDSLLYQSCELYCKRSKIEKETLEDQ